MKLASQTIQPGLVYSNLASLNAWRFHVKHFKIGSQQAMLQQTGNHQIPRKGRGMDFDEVRPYQAGDEVRHIDWRVTARTQKPHTKLFTEEEDRSVVLVVEQTNSLFFGSQNKFKSVLALDIFAILGWAAINQNDKLGLFIVKDQNEAQESQENWQAPSQQSKYLQQAFNRLTAINSQLHSSSLSSNQAWLQALQHLPRLIQPNTKIILIGDLFKLNDATDLLSKLTKHNDLIAVHLQDKLEFELPKSQIISLTDGGNTARFNTDDVATAYKDSYNQIWLQLKAGFESLKIPLISINTSDDLVPTLLEKRLLKL